MAVHRGKNGLVRGEHPSGQRRVVRPALGLEGGAADDRERGWGRGSVWASVALPVAWQWPATDTARQATVSAGPHTHPASVGRADREKGRLRTNWPMQGMHVRKEMYISKTWSSRKLYFFTKFCSFWIFQFRRCLLVLSVFTKNIDRNPTEKWAFEGW